VIMPCAKALASPPMHFFGLGPGTDSRRRDHRLGAPAPFGP
jgi:hypothetical protein